MTLPAEMYCQTGIKHNGKMYEQGSVVSPYTVFGSDTAEALAEAGALDTVPPVAKKSAAAALEITKRDAKIAELTALLEEAGVDLSNDVETEEPADEPDDTE